MTDTTTRPLPTDLAIMRAYYLPPEPTDTTVARLRGAIARIDTVTSSLRAALEQTHERDRALVADIVDAASTGDDLLAIVAGFDPVDLTRLNYQLDRLDHARATATHRLGHAERTDPAHVAWLAECKRTTDEWQHAMSGEDSSERFDNLVRFAERH